MYPLQLLVVVCYLIQVIDGAGNSKERKYYAQYHTEDKPELEYDKAWLTINTSLSFPVFIYSLNDQCYKCPLSFVATVPARTSEMIIVNTTFGTGFELRRRLVPGGQEVKFCRFYQKFREKGDYWLFLDFDNYNDRSCGVMIINDPATAEMPILYVFAGLVGLAVVLQILFCCYDSCTKRESANITDPESKSRHNLSITKLRKSGREEVRETADNGQVQINLDHTGTLHEENAPSKKERLRSLDTFRGLSLVVMMFVNYGGGGYWFFEHPPWNGITVADLVFPWFVFIMGTSINFSFKSMHRRGKNRLQMLVKIIKRSVQLFGIGIILNTNWGPVDLRYIRIPGVLQRLSLTYLVTSLMELISFRSKDSHRHSVIAPVRDIILYLHEWLMALGILGAYVALTLAFPVPGCPTGYVGPGGLHEEGKYYNCTGGAASYIDRTVLGVNHMYGNPTPKELYQTVTPHDPEGILGTLSAVFLCFLGLQAGRIIVIYNGKRSRIIRWIFWGLLTGGIGALLTKGTQNEGWSPLNKNIWSVSFVLVTGGMAFVLLSALYVIIDVLKLWKGAPFVFPGMNSIVVYCCHDIFYRFFPVSWTIRNPQHWELLLKATWDTAIWVVLAYILFRKKIFIAL